MVRPILTGLFVLGLALAGSPARADQKSDDIQTLLDLTGRNIGVSERIADARVRVTIRRFIDSHPDLTGQDVITLQTRIAAAEKSYLDALGAEMASYYYSHLSDEQIRAVIAFYKTPDGAAYLATTHDLDHTIMVIGAQKFPAFVASIRDILLMSLKGHNIMPQSAGPKAG